MTLYSLNGAVPATLLMRHRLPDCTTRTALDELTDEELAALGFVPASDMPDADPGQTVEWSGSEWIVRDLTPDELAGARVAALAVLRAERDRRLAATDFRVVVDAPWDMAPWIAYRQALRDLPENTTDPFAPSWPTDPA